METKGKKRFLNIIMVLLILVIAASGVITVGKLQGWFDKPEEAVITSGTIKGVANIERKGIGYTLNSDAVLQSGDIIETKKSTQAELLVQDGSNFILNGNTEVQIAECSAEKITLPVEKGEVFGDAFSYGGTLDVTFGGSQAMLSEAVFSVSAQTGSSLLNVYAGDISVILSDGTQERVEAGEYLSVVEEEDGTISYEINDIQITSLSEYLISQIQNCRSSAELCFTSAELQNVLDEREAEKQAALEASLNAVTISRQEADSTEADGAGEENTAAENEASVQNAAAEDQAVQSSIVDVQQSSVSEYVSGSDHTSSDSEQEEVPAAKVCTITILCDTILDNMDNLDDGKEVYVPANGTILATSKVEFEDGETVFEVLNRVCEYAGIQIEYSWTPMYNSYYIEGINNLYEFDCGNESGWMYKVNGWFPNYGCSSYYLEDGDNIVWCYTCNGLGADVGGATY